MKNSITVLLLFFVFGMKAQDFNARPKKPQGNFASVALSESYSDFRHAQQARPVHLSRNDSNLTPSWAWAANTGLGAGLSIATDQEGNSYYAGLLGESTLKKFDADGVELWAMSFGEIGRAVDTDSNGNVYFLGEFRDTLSIGDKTIIDEGYNVFLTKISANGDLIWVKENGEVGLRYGNSLVVDQFGNCFIAGEMGERGDFVAKFDSDGAFLWIQPFFNNNHFMGYNNLAVDNHGNLFLTGTKFLKKSDSYDAVIVKLDGEGRLLWAKSFGGAASDYAANIAVDQNGNSYISGRIGGELVIGGSQLLPGPFLLKYNPDGRLLWAIQDGGSGVDVDEKNNVYALSVSSNSGVDIMTVNVYNPSGKLIASQEAGGNSWKYPYAFVVDKLGNSYVTGEYIGLQGGPGEFVFGDTTIYGSSSVGSSPWDSFASKLESINAPGSSSVVENEKIASVNVHPTLVGQYLAIEFEEKLQSETVEVRIFSKKGKEMFRKYYSVNNGEIQLDLSSTLDAGLHFVKITSNQHQKTFRIVKL